MWPPCWNFLVKTLKHFCCVSGNEEKILSLPKNFFVRIFVWTSTTNFWQACRNHACKSTKDLFRSKSEKHSNAQFSKRTSFSFISLLQKLKKKLHLGTQNLVVTTLHENSCQNKFWKPFARIPEMMKILGAFPSKFFLPKTFA